MTGQDMKTWRTRRGMTQADLGHILGGLSKHAICRMERRAKPLPFLIVQYLWLLGHSNIRVLMAEHLQIAIPAPLPGR